MSATDPKQTSERSKCPMRVTAVLLNTAVRLVQPLIHAGAALVPQPWKMVSALIGEISTTNLSRKAIGLHG
jgi:hypothetical protein